MSDYSYSDDSSTDLEFEPDRLDEIEPYPISSKGFESFSKIVIFQKFEILVSEVEGGRSKNGFLPPCPLIAQQLLLHCQFNLIEIDQILKMDRESRIETIKQKVNITEPRREFDYANDGTFECEIHGDVCVTEEEDEPVGTGFCCHFTCSACLKRYLEGKGEELVIHCMFCTVPFSEGIVAIYHPKRSAERIQNIIADKVLTNRILELD